PASILGPSPTATQQPRPAGATPANQNGTGVQGELRVMADDHNNMLVIQATQHDYEIVEKTLQELDVLPRQVLIDARIYEVDLTGDLSLGLQAFIDKKSNQTPITTSGSFGSAAGGAPALALQTFAVLHNTYQLQMFLNASENRTRVKTLSAPSILVTDNT